MKTNILNMSDLTATNNDLDHKYIQKYRVHHFNDLLSGELIEIHIANLVNTFGIDAVRHVAKIELDLDTSKPIRNKKGA